MEVRRNRPATNQDEILAVSGLPCPTHCGDTGTYNQQFAPRVDGRQFVTRHVEDPGAAILANDGKIITPDNDQDEFITEEEATGQKRICTSCQKTAAILLAIGLVAYLMKKWK